MINLADLYPVIPIVLALKVALAQAPKQATILTPRLAVDPAHKAAVPRLARLSQEAAIVPRPTVDQSLKERAYLMSHTLATLHVITIDHLSVRVETSHHQHRHRITVDQ